MSRQPNVWLDPLPPPDDEPPREPLPVLLRRVCARAADTLARLAMRDELSRCEWTELEVLLVDVQEAVGEERRARFSDNDCRNREGGF